MFQKNENSDYPAPWEQGVYQTGEVEPRKNRSTLVALLLVALVLMLGVITILGVMNVRLFHKLTSNSSNLSILSGQNQNLTAIPESTPLTPGEELTVDIQPQPNTVENVPQAGGLSLQEIYTKTIDSVVSISCQNSGSTSSGTGVVLSENGYIITNCHVIENAKSILVQLGDKRRLQAVVIGEDATSDLAVLQVEAEDLIPAEFGDSDSLRVGDLVCAIGDPLGVELRGTMTDGIVSAINRDITTNGRTMTLIQTNAALNSGNSGGPLINCFGQVVGINTMKMGDSFSVAGVEGLGFAIPSTTVKTIVDQLIAQGYVSGRPYIGIQGESVSELYQYFYHLPQGLFLTQVESGSDAEQQGLAQGDILLSIDGTAVTDYQDFTTLLYNYEVGDTVEAIIFRNNRQYSVTLTVEEARG